MHAAVNIVVPIAQCTSFTLCLSFSVFLLCCVVCVCVCVTSLEFVLRNEYRQRHHTVVALLSPLVERGHVHFDLVLPGTDQFAVEHQVGGGYGLGHLLQSEYGLVALDDVEAVLLASSPDPEANAEYSARRGRQTRRDVDVVVRHTHRVLLALAVAVVA